MKKVKTKPQNNELTNVEYLQQVRLVPVIRARSETLVHPVHGVALIS